MDSYFSKLSAAVVKVALGFWDSPAAEVDENLLSYKKKKNNNNNFIKSLTLKYRKHKVLRHRVGGSQEWPKLPQSSLTSQKMKSPEADSSESLVSFSHYSRASLGSARLSQSPFEEGWHHAAFSIASAHCDTPASAEQAYAGIIFSPQMWTALWWPLSSNTWVFSSVCGRNSSVMSWIHIKQPQTGFYLRDAF